MNNMNTNAKQHPVVTLLFFLVIVSGCTKAAITQATPAPPTDPGCKTFDCYDQYYQQLVAQDGSEAALADLKTRYEQEPLVKSECHQIIHVIGRSAAKKYGSIGEAYRHGDYFCWSGYYHGVMEQILANTPAAQLVATLNSACVDMPGKDRYSFDYYNCLHGLGHGLMYISNDELFDTLKTCNALVGSWEQSSCWSGAFMENVIVDNKNHFTKYLKPDDPLYPCNAVDEQYKGTCYLMQTSYMLKLNNYQFPKVFELCRLADKKFIPVCFQSLGRDASGNSLSNVEKTKATCLLGANEMEQSNCFIGAVKDFISYYHSDSQAKELCSALPKALQPTCLDTLVAYYKNF